MSHPGTSPRPLRTTGAGLIAFLFTVALPAADIVIPPAALTRSSSGQFLVSTRVLPPVRPNLAENATNADLIVLQPAFLTVSCERIRAAFNRELDAPANWTGPIYVSLFPARTTNDTVYIHTARRRVWEYHLELPQLIDRKRFLTAVTHALLLERCNREAGSRSADVPLWMAEGLARQLVSSSKAMLVLPSPSRVVNGVAMDAILETERREHPLKATHAVLSREGILNFQELSWPDESLLTGPARERFAASAHLLVYELLALKRGQAAFQTTLTLLPSYLNWQLAFLQGFQEHFQRPLDVEKWWALHAACFAGRELNQTWPAPEADQRLDQLLRTQFELRSHAEPIPVRGETSLQAVLRDWPPAEQTEVLREKAAQLQAFSLRAPLDYAVLAEAYRQALANVLPAPGKERPSTLPRRKVEEAIRALDKLDAQRAALSEARAKVPSESRATAQTSR